MTQILILNGPNLNLLGTRQPEIYGAQSLKDIEALCRNEAQALGLSIDFRQSNHEGELVTWVQDARGVAAGLMINPAAYSHTSIALLDALLAFERPIVEVHLSNLAKRDSFRHHSYVSQAASGVVSGFGATGYVLGLKALAELIAAGDKSGD